MQGWSRMDQVARDAAYNNAAGVPGSADIVAAWRDASAATRARPGAVLDAAYGALERNRWDLFPAADPAAPCLVFIHGGYWQRNAKEGFACMAEGALARGWSAALPGYTLAPAIGVGGIVREITASLDWFQANAAAHGIAGKVILSGWSAGGHLAACAADHPRVHATIAISGIFDLAPIREVYLNDVLSLSAEEVAAQSPLLAPAKQRVATVWGASELSGLVWQSEAYVAARASAKLPGGAMPVAGANHFTVLEHLRHRQGAILDVAAALL